jgi:hypothetical protein
LFFLSGFVGLNRFNACCDWFAIPIIVLFRPRRAYRYGYRQRFDFRHRMQMDTPMFNRPDMRETTRLKASGGTGIHSAAWGWGA